MKITRSNAFALISTLAVLVVVSILVVAYLSTIRVERGASVNFSERERADAIGQAIVSRLLADHAAPLIGKTDKRLKPFTLKKLANGKDDPSYLPDADTEATYFADPPLPDIYSMRPQINLSSANSLVRISQPGEEAAFTPYDWAYSRVAVTPSSDKETQKVFLPYSSNDELITPQWVDYYEPDATAGSSGDKNPVPIGQVAFAIWDESGKVDINMAGEDISLNGMAPHNLGWENLAGSEKASLLAYLDGADKKRQRTNFSLRAINPDPTKVAPDKIGDDRWLFSVEELFHRKFFPPAAFKQLTTYSRDFDVRPEWDGDRSVKTATKFLRAYINNPELFRLFSAKEGGPQLVQNTFDETKLRATLKSAGLPNLETDAASVEWMSIMRLLAALRQILPTSAGEYGTNPMDSNKWSNADVWGIALNIAQATAPPEDQNLFAQNRVLYAGRHYLDANLRLGVRMTPMISEVAVKVRRTNATDVEVTEYLEIRNPYPVDFNGVEFYGGSWTGNGTYSESTQWGLNGLFSFFGPQRYGFSVIENKQKDGGSIIRTSKDFPVSGKKAFVMKTRPFMYPKKYWSKNTATGGGVDESVSWSTSIGPYFEHPDGGRDLTELYSLVYCIDANRFDEIGEEAWASFQIDDPRMGYFPRVAVYPGMEAGNIPSREAGITTPMSFPDPTNAADKRVYSWKYFPTSHSLPLGALPKGVPAPNQFGTTGVKTTRFQSSYGPNSTGYNENLGDTWPEGQKKFDFNRAMDTFALPRRPFLNLGELGTVYANRPWTTLTFAAKIAPNDPRLKVQPKTATTLYPTALLDYYTTLGTKTQSVALPFQKPGPTPFPAGTIDLTNAKERRQSKSWLFEDVEKTGEPKANTNLRPIRGRINLNSASTETLTSLLMAPYRIARSQGLENRMNNPGLLTIKPLVATDRTSDLLVTIDNDTARKIAVAIAGDPDKGTPSMIRPLRSLGDLAKLDAWPISAPANLISQLHTTIPDPVVDAIMGRLAQFGTVRQQIAPGGRGSTRTESES